MEKNEGRKITPSFFNIFAPYRRKNPQPKRPREKYGLYYGFDESLVGPAPSEEKRDETEKIKNRWVGSTSSFAGVEKKAEDANN